ncbi:MAG: hypothetical protein DWQ19_10755 [Crenarchaeota archaeon]|nr:MAG: hypothetical protein DWQ19_10755 [Thermoproteota archaeon]
MRIKHKYVIFAAIIAVATVIAVQASLQHRLSVHHSSDPFVNAIIEFQEPVSVKQIHVLTGDEYDLILDNGDRIHAKLDVRTTPLAKSKVLEFINRCKNPRAILKKDLGNHLWLVELYVTTQDENIEVSLSKWLQEKNLAYR